ncbi:myc target protein 1 homolog [Megalops cyprinoides]|uniref:myc target protein 1 homolog n=1 Tax=Megalops cyprinoides TaxID=118141 RepID=UPI00186429B7|nr:myc target protein 1 homolog [Megalops cyprinoides]
MTDKKRDFILDLLQINDFGSLILVFCLSMLVGLLVGTLIYILLTWLARRRASAHISRRTRASPRSPHRDRFGFFRHSGASLASATFGLYRRASLEGDDPEGGDPSFRAAIFHPLLPGDPVAHDNERTGRTPPVRMSSFRTNNTPLKPPPVALTAPPPYESVLLAFHDTCPAPAARIVGSTD